MSTFFQDFFHAFLRIFELFLKLLSIWNKKYIFSPPIFLKISKVNEQMINGWSQIVMWQSTLIIRSARHNVIITLQQETGLLLLVEHINLNTNTDKMSQNTDYRDKRAVFVDLSTYFLHLQIG